MHIHRKALAICLLFTFSHILAQEEDLKLSSKDSIVTSSWMIGLGYNIVDDSGDAFNDFTTIKNQWNAVAFPSRVSVGRYFKSGLGLEVLGTYNNYKQGFIIDGVVNPEDISFFAIDSRLSYDLNKIIGETAWFDPYIGIGLGYTDANNTPRGTYNAVIGFRTWLSDKWGLDLNSSGKWAMGDNGATNYIQHGAGVVYRFGIEKGLSKKGLEKLVSIEEIAKERERVQDSIASVNRAKEEAALAERLAMEKEQKRLADVEKAKIDAENKRKSEIEDRIKRLGFIYFALNSSYIRKESLGVLDKLANLMNEIPELELKVTSHTDSRGASEYNQWLSKKRADQTKNYLVKKGIDSKRLQVEANGEDRLLNDCDDNTYCTEEKHKINRRSEFIATKF